MSKASWLILAVAACGSAQAAEAASCRSRTHLPYAVQFRMDNDLFGAKSQDQGYTNGIQLTFASANLKDYEGDACLPWSARLVDRFLSKIEPAGGFDSQNTLFTINQSLFTPQDYWRRDLIRDDRPYAAALLFGFGYQARKGNAMQTTLLQLGMVGPAALGRQVQDGAHRIFGSHKFEGWSHQLHNEPVFMLQHERFNRFAWGQGKWTWDAITHYGGALGTYQTFVNGGAELRFGIRLPDDFGSTPLSPAGETTAPRSQTRPGGPLRFHAFLTTDARWVGRDISLDGNTWRDSHSVDKRPFVGYIGIGVAFMKGRWKYTFAQYHSTREFDGQREVPVFGSFTISRAL